MVTALCSVLQTRALLKRGSDCTLRAHDMISQYSADFARNIRRTAASSKWDLVTCARSVARKIIAVHLRNFSPLDISSEVPMLVTSVPRDFALLQLDVRSDDSVRSALEHTAMRNQTFD